ncbi:hypothetical protein SAMN04488105_1368 [Salipiger thiooxidans]|uniref:HEAT repeat domain-containing protein n=1 Tax=Salipiger thiooxidans TaxID=282683 RepID=A0A1G7MID8_9RHOB|nr:hypothetical protein [Salipiger thiooxidans]SDF61535.1 hypothetical protein SAMN04488105_1368 [Salipiger thiooxidans]
MAIRQHALACLLALSAFAAEAQVSLGDLDAAMSARDDEMAAFRERLNDPDSDRALTAMRLLIAKGDADQRQMAIEHGLSSTNTDIRLAAVGAILGSRPILVSRWFPEDGEMPNSFRNRVSAFNGTTNTDKSARVPLQIGKYLDEANCWLINDAVPSPRNCLFRINSGEISTYVGGSWAQLDLDEAGRLVGSPMIGGIRTEIVVDLGL